MRRHSLTLVMLIVALHIQAQFGIANKALSLQDNSFVGILWEPTGTINYSEKNGEGVYGLVISMNTSDTYLDIEKGHKVSIEFIDDTREVLLVQEVDKSYSNTVVKYRIVNVYKTNVLIYPNYEVLISKPIRRIVIQRTNGKVWIIETKAKRAKKLLVEFKKSMSEAYSSYKNKIANDNYFNE